MQRQIKFRGKNVCSDEWVYGTAVQTQIGDFIIAEDTQQNPHICPQYGYMEVGEFAEVWSNTVGQFTGLFDNEGKEIYEGDILVFGSPSDDAFDDCPFEVANNNPAYEVKWFDGRYIIRSKFDDADELCDNLCGVGPGSVGVTSDCVRKHFKIIGNVYDNPGLIKRDNEQNV